MRLKPFVLIAACLAMPVAAEACSCMVYETVEEKLEQTEVAFFGVPQTDTPADEGAPMRGEHETRFSVWRSFVSPDEPALTVTHRLSSAACGTRFEKGKPQLIIAYRSDDGTLHTDSCTNISYTNDGKNLLDALDAAYPKDWWW